MARDITQRSHWPACCSADKVAKWLELRSLAREQTAGSKQTKAEPTDAGDGQQEDKDSTKGSEPTGEGDQEQAADANWFTHGVNHYGFCEMCRIYWLMAVNKFSHELAEELEMRECGEKIFQKYGRINPMPAPTQKADFGFITNAPANDLFRRWPERLSRLAEGREDREMQRFLYYEPFGRSEVDSGECWAVKAAGKLRVQIEPDLPKREAVSLLLAIAHRIDEEGLHNPGSDAAGDPRELRNLANSLDGFRQQVANELGIDSPLFRLIDAALHLWDAPAMRAAYDLCYKQ